MTVDPAPDLIVNLCAAGLIDAGHDPHAVGEAAARAALAALSAVHGACYAGDWLASIGRAAARGRAVTAAENAMIEFEQTGLSLEGKRKILAAMAEIADADSQPKLVADALMGAALSYITDAAGLRAKMVYLRVTADQIEEALARGGSAAS